MAPGVMAVFGVWMRLPVSGTVCPTRRRHVLALASTTFVFFAFLVFNFFLSMFFDCFFFFTQETARGPSFINNLSSEIHRIQARIALLSPPGPTPSRGEGCYFFHTQLQYFFPDEGVTKIRRAGGGGFFPLSLLLACTPE